MPHDPFASLSFQALPRVDDCDLFEAVDRSDADPARHVYSCVALCRTNWAPGVRALGGTRRLPNSSPAGRPSGLDDAIIERVRSEAVGLAKAMYVKNTLLRFAAERWKADGGGSRAGFAWQGGKGVVWSPPGEDRELEAHRLLCHGRLIEHLAGEYIGSKDQRVGDRELRTLASQTAHVIGLGCRWDTGEATALGVLSGLVEAAHRLRLGTDPDRPLRGVRVLVVGLGKVGLPLLLGLHEEGAEVYGLEVAEHVAEGTEEGIRRHFERQLDRGGAVDVRHRDLLLRLRAEGRLFASEAAALAWGEFDVLSPNGGAIEWLVEPVAGGGAEAGAKQAATGAAGAGEIRAERLARVAREKGRLRLVAGAGNDQVPLSEGGAPRRRRALAALSAAGVWFVPDPLVSPGGVIAVSHEELDRWERVSVNHDAWGIVRVAVGRFFDRYRELAGTSGGGAVATAAEPDAEVLWATLEDLVESSWR